MTQTTSHAPERTCAGCRERDARDALLRFVVRPEAPRLVPDVRRRLPGRGVSVHPRRACLDKAVRQGGFARALKGPPGVDLETLTEMVVTQYDRRLEGLLSSAARQRRVAVGSDLSSRALDAGEAKLLWVAVDAAGRREQLVGRAVAREVPALARWNKQKLGGLVGRAEVGVLAILDERIALEVVATALRATDVSEAE